MAEYIPFSEDQLIRAGEVDLTVFLRDQGEGLKREGRNYRLQSDHSVTVRGNLWFDHATGEGGHAISFVQRQYGLSFPEAVTTLLGGELGRGYPAASRVEQQLPRPPFALPPAHTDMRQVFAYLLNRRHLSRDVVAEFAHQGLLYESCEPSKDGSREYHNAVFVGLDENNVPRHAHKRSLNNRGHSLRLTVESSDPAYSFFWPGPSDRLYVFEAPIDMLSFLTLHPQGWQEHSYLALCGLSEHSLLKRLKLYPQLQKVCLCLDHDPAGIEADGRLTEILRERGYTNVAAIKPRQKDWNEDVKAGLGLPCQAAEEHPQTAAAQAVFERLCHSNRVVVDPERKLQYWAEQYKDSVIANQYHANECLEQMMTLTYVAMSSQYRHLGEELSWEDYLDSVRALCQPHHNRAKLLSRTELLLTQVKAALWTANQPDVRMPQDIRQAINRLQGLAVDCAKTMILLEVEAQRQTQDLNLTETPTETPIETTTQEGGIPCQTSLSL